MQPWKMDVVVACLKVAESPKKEERGKDSGFVERVDLRRTRPAPAIALAPALFGVRQELGKELVRGERQWRGELPRRRAGAAIKEHALRQFHQLAPLAAALTRAAATHGSDRPRGGELVVVGRFVDGQPRGCQNANFERWSFGRQNERSANANAGAPLSRSGGARASQ